MKILLSIKPYYAEKIFSGEKKYEFRKILPRRIKVSTVVIYATKPVGKVVGEFVIDSFITETPSKLWIITKKHSGVSKKTYNQYFKGRKKAHAIVVKQVIRYETPFALNHLSPHLPAPQSFYYIG
ncbi:hypothetical protein [Commensalibacter melissae]|uniref:hypothetical protein n=1 Tax=Commensalibacter melissae TaxID=2070537 RepID=UPI0012D8F7AE|nr:hypothetical protein [Commensalibacter melissae]MUG82071.1 hypothetical protein [Commensalibacter melissae]